MKRLEAVLGKLKKAGITLRLLKCVFALEEVEYLGFTVSAAGILPGARKLAALKEFPVPANKHELRRFLGLTSFFRRFVPKYAGEESDDDYVGESRRRTSGPDTRWDTEDGPAEPAIDGGGVDNKVTMPDTGAVTARDIQVLNLPRVLRPRETIRPPVRYLQMIEAHEKAPTYEEAVAGKEAREWTEAMEKEYRGLEQRGTWTVVRHVPPQERAIGTKWELKKKVNSIGEVTYKARLVAQGCA